MNKFTQLIAQGIAPNRYDDVYIGSAPNSDPFVRGYNNVWGVVSDTHMSSYGEDQYIITGSMIKDSRKFSQFLYSSHWGGYGFNASEAAKVNGVCSLSGYLYKNGLVGSFSKVNNDDVYLISPINVEALYTPRVCGDQCACHEDLKAVFKDRETMESIFIENTPIKDIITNLNESKNVNGQDWMLIGDVDGLKLVNENHKYITLK